jgi:hypothetical protein
MHVCRCHLYIYNFFYYKILHIPMYTRIMNNHGWNIVLRYILQLYDTNFNTEMTK